MSCSWRTMALIIRFVLLALLAQETEARSVSENSVVGPRANGFLELSYSLLDQGSRSCVTGKDGEAGDVGVYRRYSRT